MAVNRSPGEFGTDALRSPAILVGREREQAILREDLDVVMRGRGRLVLLGGEAGIGKTALAEDLAREASGRGVRVVIGRCYDLTNVPPYGPWLDLVADYQPAAGLPSPPARLCWQSARTGHRSGRTLRRRSRLPRRPRRRHAGRSPTRRSPLGRPGKLGAPSSRIASPAEVAGSSPHHVPFRRPDAPSSVRPPVPCARARDGRSAPRTAGPRRHCHPRPRRGPLPSSHPGGYSPLHLSAATCGRQSLLRDRAPASPGR